MTLKHWRVWPAVCLCACVRLPIPSLQVNLALYEMFLYNVKLHR